MDGEEVGRCIATKLRLASGTFERGNRLPGDVRLFQPVAVADMMIDPEDLASYEGTPWLTALVNFCTAVGLMIAIYAAIFLAGEWHLGCGTTGR
jgi:hypothetical protein